jgi:transposase InsO family protein
VVHADNEDKYTSSKFDYFCMEAQMKRELTIPYNPQHNGVEERKNRYVF